MISAFDIYLIGNMDSICNFFTFLSALFFGIVIICAIAYNAKDDEEKINVEKQFVKSCALFIIFCLIACILPSSRTMASMMVIPPVVNSVAENKQIQQIPQAVLDLIKSYENNDVKKEK